MEDRSRLLSVVALTRLPSIHELDDMVIVAPAVGRMRA